MPKVDPSKDFNKLIDALSTFVGEDTAKKWVEDRKARLLSYGLPATKGKYTAYGELRNLDVRPSDFLPDPGAVVTLVPSDKWNSSAGGEFSLLGGIRIPQRATGGFAQEQALVHEGQHQRDVKTGGNKANVYNYDDKLLKEVNEAMEKEYNKRPTNAFTLRSDIGEVLPEIRDWVSQLPAGTTLQSTELFKQLSNVAQAMLLRRLNPLPAGVDAIVGSLDFK